MTRPASAAGGSSGAAGTRTDAELLHAHVEGDDDAFAELVRRHSPRLWALAYRMLGDREDAADALQDAFVSAFRGAGGFRGDAAVTTWLHRVVVNACLDRMRRQRVRPTVPLDAPGRDDGDARTGAERLPARGDEHADTELRLDVRAALAELPPHQRAALVLVDLHDLSVADAAQVLDVAPGTVKSRCARGRSALAEVLRSRGVVVPAPARRNRTDVCDVPDEGPAVPVPPARDAGPGASPPRTDGTADPEEVR